MLVSTRLGQLWNCTPAGAHLTDSAGGLAESYWTSMDLVTFGNNRTEVAAKGFLFIAQGLRSGGK